MSVPLAIVICTEPGRLEKQSLLLVESIRKFAGQFKDVPIYSFHPRKGEPISQRTQDLFNSFNVVHQQIILNQKYHDYYLANKIVAPAYAEKNLDADILVYIDSDQCVLKEPQDFLLPDNFDIGLRPEYGKGVGSTGIKDRQDGYWQKLYQELNVKNNLFIETPIGEKKIRAYWNGGMIVARRKVGVFTAWKNNFEKIMDLNIVPEQGNYFVEQSTLAATVCAMKKNVFTLHNSYSYPLTLHNRFSKKYKIKNFDDLVTIHHLNMFFYGDWQKRFKNLKKMNLNSDRYQWLCQKIREYDMPFKNPIHDRILKIRRVEQKLKIYKIDINFSYWLENLLIT